MADPTGRGRFDLLREMSGCLYVADSPEHAVAEVIQPWRGQKIGSPHLLRAGYPLALVQVTLPLDVASKLMDLCDPRVLSKMDIPPDTTASRFREITRPLAKRAWRSGAEGLRWWSAFWGDWHTTVLFTARVADRIDFGDPRPLTLDEPALREAAELLGIQVMGSGPQRVLT